MATVIEQTGIEWVMELTDHDLEELCQATEEAILDGNGFGWLTPPPRRVLESFWHGVLLVPERELIVARLEGSIVGSAQLQRPSSNNEAQSFAARITTFFLAPWARAHGLGQAMLDATERRARDAGFGTLELDVRATQSAAIRLYERAGFRRWATKDKYAFVGGQFVPGYYFEKDIGASSR
jgi:ribosomal protein S18 acetylase RimI-like enzyme